MSHSSPYKDVLRPTSDVGRSTSYMPFAYFGTPDFSTLVLDALEEAGITPTLIVTTPDKPAGRGLTQTMSPVKKWALTRDIPLCQPEKFDDAALEEISQAGADFGIVAAYGKLLPQSVLDRFPRGILNVHPSLLPCYRGTSPVESQILADETTIGVSVIEMDSRMDHGPILAQENVVIPEWPVDRNQANEIFWKTGGKLLARTLPKWIPGTIVGTPQDETKATFTKKMAKEDGELDLSSSPRKNYLKYLAYAGWPGTYFMQGGKRVKITSAEFAGGEFRVLRIIPEGKREISFADFSRRTG